MAWVLIGNKRGYINHGGKLVIPAVYDSADDFIQGSAKVGISDGEYLKYSLINSSGKRLTVVEYDSIGGIKGDKYVVEKNGCWGIIDVKGQEIVPCIYTAWSSGMFHEVLWLDKEKKIIDYKGNITDDHPIFNSDIDYEEGGLPF